MELHRYSTRPPRAPQLCKGLLARATGAANILSPSDPAVCQVILRRPDIQPTVYRPHAASLTLLWSGMFFRTRTADCKRKSLELRLMRVRTHCAWIDLVLDGVVATTVPVTVAVLCSRVLRGCTT